jgi:hypothetical protein
MKQHIVSCITKDSMENAVKVHKHLVETFGVTSSVKTVRRALQEAGLVAFVKPKKPLISEVNRKKRLEWAQKYLFWTIDYWQRVIWSDEVKINRYGSDGKHYTWKRPHEQLQAKHVQQTIKHGGGNVMVWSCITWEGVGFITKIDTTMDKHLYLDILKEDLVNTMKDFKMDPKEIIFQQDNDPQAQG